MIKRVLMTMLSFCIAVSGIGFGAAAKQTAADGQESIRFLTDMGIITSEIEDESNPISREAFAAYAAKMLRLDTTAGEEVRYFTDVEADGYAAGAINTLAECGVISMAEDLRYRPQEHITTEEAAKMLAVALGYKDEAEYRGGFPSGYLTVASRLDIVNGQSAGEKISFADAFDMIVGAMEAPLLSIEVFKADGTVIKYDTDGENTILKNIWKIYEADGMVTSVYGSTTGDVVDEKNHMGIDNTIYETSDGVDAADFFGEYVTAYYRETDGNIGREIVSIRGNGGAENIIIAPDYFKSFEGRSLSYYTESGRSKEVSLDNPIFVYNGYPLLNNISKTLSGINKGEIVVKDGNGNGVYDIVVIKDYANFVVSSADTSMVYDKLGTEAIVWADYKNYTICNVSGNAVPLTEIKAGQTLSVAYSADKHCLEVIVSETEVSGSISEIKNTDGIYYLTVNSEVYPVEKSYAEKIKDTYIANAAGVDAYTFKTDVFGNIVYIIQKSAEMQAGYILGDILENSGLTSVVKLKIMTQAGKIEEFELEDRVRINNTVYRNAEEAYASIPSGDLSVMAVSGKQQIIRYTVNSDGKINTVQTASYNAWNGDENSGFLQLYEKTEQKRYMRTRLGAKATMTSNTVVFFIPNSEGSVDEKRCFVSKYSDLSDGLAYLSNAYIFSREGLCADAVVCYYDAENLAINHVGYVPIVMVDTISEKLNDDGEIVQCVSGYSLGSKVEYLALPEVKISGIEEGDIVKFSFDRNSTIVSSDYDILCKRSNIYEDGRPGWSGNALYDYLYTDSNDSQSGYYRATFQLSFGYVTNVSGEDAAWDYEPDGRFDETSKISGNVVIYDSSRREGQRIYVGKAEDIRTYAETGMDCGKIIFRTRDFVQQESFVYQ